MPDLDMAALLSARLIDLGHPLTPGMPQSRQAPPYTHSLAATHDGRWRPDGVSVATDLLSTGTHVGTHVDALCHVAHLGKLHGGAEASAAQSGGRFATGGAEEIPPLVCRGILLDFTPDRRAGSSAPADLAITDVLLGEAERRSRIRILAGDVVLLRVGWASKFSDRDAFLGAGTGLPGLDESGARWLAHRGVRAVGSDTLALERVPADSGAAPLPVHRALLVEHGIWIIESLALDELAEANAVEFVFVMSPLKLVGATASPIRPLALLTRG